MIIPWQQAKNLVVCNPDTGLEIPHVKATDPDKGWVETYTTTPCAPFEGMEMVKIIRHLDGTETTETYNYTFVSMRDFAGSKYYLSHITHCRFDVVNKYTGEVLFEVEGPEAPLMVLDPIASCSDKTLGHTNYSKYKG